MNDQTTRNPSKFPHTLAEVTVMDVERLRSMCIEQEDIPGTREMAQQKDKFRVRLLSSDNEKREGTSLLIEKMYSWRGYHTTKQIDEVPNRITLVAEFDGRRQQFRALARDTREKLMQIYALTLDGIGSSATEKEQQLVPLKQAAMADFHRRYADLKAQWGGYSGYDAWVARSNNATFGVQAAYDDLVPGFLALFEREGLTGSFWLRCVSSALARPKLPSAFSKSIGLTLCGMVELPTSPAFTACLK